MAPGRADRFEREQLALDLREHQFAVGHLGRIQPRSIETFHALLNRVQRHHLRIHRGSRIVFELRVVLMEPGCGARRRLELEEHVAEVIVHQRIPRRLTRTLRRGRARESHTSDNQYQREHNHRRPRTSAILQV